ncbi:MAG: DUF1905 domain-containing protein [Chitinophagaceae bacterium]
MRYRIKYEFDADMWQSNGKGAWYFITVPQAISDEIRTQLQWQGEGWGRMRAEAIITGISWQTAIWFDTKQGAYLLPIKADIRKRTGLVVGEKVSIKLEV